MTATTIQYPSSSSSSWRRSLVGFAAGVVLTAAAAVGINAVADDAALAPLGVTAVANHDAPTCALVINGGSC